MSGFRIWATVFLAWIPLSLLLGWLVGPEWVGITGGAFLCALALRVAVYLWRTP